MLAAGQDKEGLGQSEIARDEEFDDAGEHAECNFEESVWSALLLVNDRLPNGSLLIKRQDTFARLVATLGSLALQTVFIITIYYNMPGNPYGSDTIEMMASWRATHGHSFFNRDPNTGDTLIGKLCSKTLWRYEQEEYETLDNFINGDVPGVMLGFLALVIWVMSIFKEYRNLNEQFVGLWLLPKTGWGLHTAQVDEDGIVIILAIASLERWALILGVYFLRLLIMIALCYVGCQWICQTPSLPDLVLNAIALEFVLDIDELLFSVLFSRRIQQVIASAAPLPMGKRRKVLGMPLREVTRMVLLILVISLTTTYVLLPFKTSVESAEAALCKGRDRFLLEHGVCRSSCQDY